MSGYSENVSFVDSVSKDGVKTTLHFEGDQFIVQKTFDAEPHLRYAEEARQATDGMDWGNGRMIAHIPSIYYAQFAMIKDNAERKKAIRIWLKENPKFLMFHRALK